MSGALTAAQSAEVRQLDEFLDENKSQADVLDGLSGYLRGMRLDALDRKIALVKCSSEGGDLVDLCKDRDRCDYWWAAPKATDRALAEVLPLIAREANQLRLAEKIAAAQRETIRLKEEVRRERARLAKPKAKARPKRRGAK